MEDNTIINFDKFLDNHSFSDEQLEKRKKNYKKFNDEGFPNKKLEDWKFSDLNQIIKKNIKNFVIEKSETNKSQDTDLIKDFDHNKIYIQDGKLISYDFSFEKEKRCHSRSNESSKSDREGPTCHWEKEDPDWSVPSK